MGFYSDKMEALRRASKFTPELDFTPPLPPEGKTKGERFSDFDAKNPQVYENIVKLAFERLAEDGRVGMKDIFEEIRRKYRKHTVSAEHPKGRRYNLDNSYTPYYSRKLTKEYLIFAGHIEQRSSKVTV